MINVNFRNWTVGFLLGFFMFQNGVFANETSENQMNETELEGKNYFEGNRRLENGGVACISCHTVQNKNVVFGGLLAKDLTDVYSRMGEGIAAWLMAPPFPAMETSYRNHPITENERTKLTAFFKYVNENQDEQAVKTGQGIMLLAGGGGVLTMIVLVSLIWYNRKRKMVKQDIFSRQISARDAKF